MDTGSRNWKMEVSLTTTFLFSLFLSFLFLLNLARDVKLSFYDYEVKPFGFEKAV